MKYLRLFEQLSDTFSDITGGVFSDYMSNQSEEYKKPEDFNDKQLSRLRKISDLHDYSFKVSKGDYNLDIDDHKKSMVTIRKIGTGAYRDFSRTIKIHKCEDEWYVVSDIAMYSGNRVQNFYLCDQFDSLKSCLIKIKII